MGPIITYYDGHAQGKNTEMGKIISIIAKEKTNNTQIDEVKIYTIVVADPEFYNGR